MVENETRKVKAIPLRRLKMSRPTERLAAPINFGKYRCRRLTDVDGAMIGRLLCTSFRGTIDDAEHQTDEQWRNIAIRTFWQGICHKSSLVLFEGNTPICAMVVVPHRHSRSLDLAMTHPFYRGQGLAELLIRQCLHNLNQTGVQSMSLWVTEQNAPALRLYEKLGFETQSDFYCLKVVFT
jgi:ribosomal protein S18 acetylase RimI-like enzyme